MTIGSERESGMLNRSIAALAPQRHVVRDLHDLPESLARVGALELKFAVTKKEIRKAQRLRYRVFFEQGAAQADRSAQILRRDVCPFDMVCDHLIVVDHEARSRYGRIKPKVVGTYRLLRQNRLRADGGFYSAQEFDVAPLLARHADKTFLELGRSCVLPEYRARRTLELLWRGIWTYVRHHGVDVMIGCASFDTVDPRDIAVPLSFLHHHAGAPAEWSARALPQRRVDMAFFGKGEVAPRRAIAATPTLIKGYVRLGAMIGDGAVVDHRFGTTDVLIVLPVARIDPRYIDHFGGANAPVNDIAA